MYRVVRISYNSHYRAPGTSLSLELLTVCSVTWTPHVQAMVPLGSRVSCNFLTMSRWNDYAQLMLVVNERVCRATDWHPILCPVFLR